MKTFKIIYSQNMRSQFNQKHGTLYKSFSLRTCVIFKRYEFNKFKWKSGIVVDNVGSVIFMILDKNGVKHKCHANKLRKLWISDEIFKEREKFPELVRVDEDVERYALDLDLPKTPLGFIENAFDQIPNKEPPIPKFPKKSYM